MSTSVVLMVSPCSSITGTLPYAWCGAKLMLLSTLMAITQLILMLGLLFVVLIVITHFMILLKK